jgi:hypothetical protein
MTSITSLARVLLGTVVLGGAFVLWSASGTASELAAGHERLATFRDQAPGGQTRRLWSSAIERSIDREAIHDAAARDYWHGRYEALTSATAGREQDDAAAQMIAANASFRQMQRQAGNRPLTVDELDRALQAYAGVLKNAGFDREAAWNYEYIARLRDAAAREKPPARQAAGKAAGAAAAAGPAAARRDTSGLPAGPTIHGRPGLHPPSTKGEEFEVITPMDYGDREAQPEPTPGVKLPRKG